MSKESLDELYSLPTNEEEYYAELMEYEERKRKSYSPRVRPPEKKGWVGKLMDSIDDILMN